MVNETENRIEFAFPLEALFQKISLQSLYSAKNMGVTANGQDAADAYGVMTDEQDFVNAHVPKAIADLFALFIKQTNTVLDSLFSNKKLNSVDCCGFSLVREIQNGVPLYNPNRLVLIDYNCEAFLKNYILLEWAKANKLGDNITIHQNDMNENIRHIRNNNFELKKGQYAKTYEPFPPKA